MVYKVLIKNYKVSPFMGAMYSINENMPKEKFKIERILDNYGGDFYVINEGYHSYSKGIQIEKDTDTNVITIYPSHRQRILGYYDGQQVAIFKAYIPIGTKYYVNSFGEIVSECLRVTDKIVF